MEKGNSIRIGKPDVEVDAPSHVKGVPEGNSPGRYEKMEGHLPDGRSTARRSTGINADAKEPIMDDMPSLSPA